jgi:hypothetical protein
MQYQGQPDACPQTLGVGRDGDQRFGGGLEQQAIDPIYGPRPVTDSWGRVLGVLLAVGVVAVGGAEAPSGSLPPPPAGRVPHTILLDEANRIDGRCDMAARLREALEAFVNEKIEEGYDPRDLFEELRREANQVFGHFNLEYEFSLIKRKDQEG